MGVLIFSWIILLGIWKNNFNFFKTDYLYIFFLHHGKFIIDSIRIDLKKNIYHGNLNDEPWCLTIHNSMSKLL